MLAHHDNFTVEALHRAAEESPVLASEAAGLSKTAVGLAFHTFAAEPDPVQGRYIIRNYRGRVVDSRQTAAGALLALVKQAQRQVRSARW